MTKIYKNAEAFLKENFPISYLDFKREEETSLKYHIDVLSEQFNKSISKILKGEFSTSQNKKTVQTSRH